MTKEQNETAKKEFILLDIKDVMQLTGWSENIVRNLFAYNKDFPAIKIGKKYQVELSSLKNYLGERRIGSWKKK